MEITFGVLIFCIAAFFVAGFIDSVAGGAGFVTAPSLLLVGLPPHVALGTGKLATTIGSLVALWTFWRGNLILMKIVPVGVISAMIGASTGAWCALQIDSAVLGKIIVIMLPLGILFTIFSGGFKLGEGELPKKFFWTKVVLIGVCIGFYEGFFGPGAGTFFLIALHIFLKMGLVQASGTAKAFNIAANFSAFCMFATGDCVSYQVALPCALASMLGNRVGAMYAIKVGGTFVRNILYVVVTLLIVSLAYRYFFAS